MRHIILLLALSFSIASFAQEITWKRHEVDGHRTGVTQGAAGKTVESMGEVKKFKSYYSPNGKRYKKKTSTRKTAKHLIKAQSSMSSVKEVIGFSTKAMSKQRPECALTNWFIDFLMLKTSELTGKHVDIGFANFGGVRTDMPEGEIFRDDIMSMFPFKNTLYYFSMKGENVKKLMQDMALPNAEINGEPIIDDKIYGVATIDFLMEGSGWFRFGKYAIDRQDTKVLVMDAMLQYVEEQTKLGKKIEYRKDGRIKKL